MSVRLPAYPEYKDSGVEWLGQIPSHWRMVRTKFLFDERVEKGFPDEPLLAATQTKGVVPKSHYESRTVTAQKDFHLLKLVKEGDYVISLRSFQGGIEYAHYRGIISPAYSVLKPSSRLTVSRDYFEFFFKSQAFISSLTLFVTGIREGQNIDYARLSRASLPLPAAEDQIAIGRFLRHLTGVTNRLLRDKRRLIALLNEQKQAIIHHAVTKGLNPDVLMKPSGVEWLGDIPVHWRLTKIKWVFKTMSGSTPPSNGPRDYYGGSIPWIRTTDLANDVVDTFAIGITEYALKETPCKLLPRDSVLVAMYGGAGTIGKNGILAIDAAVNQALCGLIPNPRFMSQFVFRFMQFQRPYWMIGADGTRKDPNISQERIRDCTIVEPPRPEQEIICSYIDEQCRAINSGVNLANREIELIREYRTRLISDVVTGKLDVRNAVLPDDFPGSEDTTEELIEAEADEQDDAIESDAQEMTGSADEYE